MNKRKRAKKKKSPATRRSMGMGKRVAQTVEGYLARVEEPARSTLEKMRAAIRAAVPAGSSEVISYGIPGFRHERMLVWYAAFREHCSFFPTASVIQRFEKELAGFRISKGTIQFPIERPLPAALVKKMVKQRVADSLAKKKRRS